jgi:uncharacterized protein (DUF433 family)
MMMATELIHDRGRGPELVGTRITVYNLLPHFLDPGITEADICRIYELTPEQVAAARAYVLCNPETVLAKHLEIEARLAAGNSPELIEKARETHAIFLNFKEWLANRQQAEALEGHTADTNSNSEKNGSRRFPTFKEWLAQHESRPKDGP